MRANFLRVHGLKAARGATLLIIDHHFQVQNVGASSRPLVSRPRGCLC